MGRTRCGAWAEQAGWGLVVSAFREVEALPLRVMHAVLGDDHSEADAAAEEEGGGGWGWGVPFIAAAPPPPPPPEPAWVTLSRWKGEYLTRVGTR